MSDFKITIIICSIIFLILIPAILIYSLVLKTPCIKEWEDTPTCDPTTGYLLQSSKITRPAIYGGKCDPDTPRVGTTTCPTKCYANWDNIAPIGSTDPAKYTGPGWSYIGPRNGSTLCDKKKQYNINSYGYPPCPYTHGSVQIVKDITCIANIYNSTLLDMNNSVINLLSEFNDILTKCTLYVKPIIPAPEVGLSPPRSKETSLAALVHIIALTNTIKYNIESALKSISMYYSRYYFLTDLYRYCGNINSYIKSPDAEYKSDYWNNIYQLSMDPNCGGNNNNYYYFDYTTIKKLAGNLYDNNKTLQYTMALIKDDKTLIYEPPPVVIKK